jgi:hypothetical protein
MHALPFLLALAGAALIAPALLRELAKGGHVRENFRGRALPVPFGVLTPAVALLVLGPLMLIARLAPAEVFHPEILPIALYALGVALLGLIDDTLGRRPGSARGWRGHGAAALRGQLSTGVLKAAGSLGLALLAMSFLDVR